MKIKGFYFTNDRYYIANYLTPNDSSYRNHSKTSTTAGKKKKNSVLTDEV
jgi:hypothetical protein